MRLLGTALLALCAISLAVPAGAQSKAAAPKRAPAKPAARRIWISVSGGVQPAASQFNDAFDLTLYTEKEHITVDYPSKSGVLVAASGGYRVWKRLAVGLGLTHYTTSGDAKVTAQLPHPFFDNTFRAVEGTARTPRTETGAHLMIGALLPISPRLRVLLTAGPSAISVTQRIVTDVTFSETYPYDTALFTGVRTSNGSRTGAGYNAGADVFWMFARQIGAGGLVQVTHARVRADAAAGRSVSFDAGGAQAAAGLRFVF